MTGCNLSRVEKTGEAELPLHYGKASEWLLSRMRRLAENIVVLIIDEYGGDELLRKLSNPGWFQALGCVLGYDWHSSGVTTIVTGVLKSVVRPEYGIAIAGGKGEQSLRTPYEIKDIGRTFDFSDKQVNGLVYASRMSAKVDSTAIQAGYDLYHHAFFVSAAGKWVVFSREWT